MIAPNLGTSAKPSAHKGQGFTRRGRNAIACPAKVSAGTNGVCPSKKDGRKGGCPCKTAGAFSVCPVKKEGHKGGCPSKKDAKKDACPHKGWPVLRFGLMVGLGL